MKFLAENLNRWFCFLIGKPWVKVTDYNRGNAKMGLHTLDVRWNRHLIKKLRKAGYEGEDQVVIEQWVLSRMKEVEAREAARHG